MTTSDNKKPKDKEPEIDFTQFTVDDIARRMLKTPPKPKTAKKKIKLIPQADVALAELKELVGLSHRDREVAKVISVFINQGTPLFTANVDWKAAEMTGNALVSYQLAEGLHICLAAARARNV